MAQYDFQVLVIGSGPGGYVAAIRAAQLGFSVACVEKMPTLGGTCLNVGCIPSKALLQTSESWEWIEKSAAEQGISVKEATFDFAAMMKRKETIVKGLTDGVAGAFNKNKIERIIGAAKFTGPHTVDIGGRQITAGNIIIATGSEPISLPFLPFDETVVVSSTGALSLPKVPKKLLVVGAGVIGVELASVYRRLGSEVSIVEMLDTITPAMDAAVCKQLQTLLKKQGLEFYLGAKVKEGSHDKKTVSLTVEHQNNTVKMDGDVVLVAVGRRPFTKDLALEKASLALSPKGFIPVDANLRTTQPHIYAIGDVIDGPMLAHRASHEGIAAAELIAGQQPTINYMGIPNVIYTHPEVAAVGFTEAEARAAGLELFIGTSFFRGNGRARCMGDTEGFVKIIGEKTSGRLVGMHIIGPHASELIAEGMMAIDKKATVADIMHACHAHPTLSETIMEAAQQALGQAIHG